MDMLARTTTSPDVRTLWYTRCPVPTASSVAVSEGWLDREFAPDQIAVRSLAQSRNPDRRLAHYTHAHPALLREGGIIPPLWARATTGASRLIGLARVDQFHGLLALRGSQVAEAAGVPGASLYPARENVRLYTAEAQALIRGQVDAIYAAGPHALATAAMIDAVPVAASRADAHLRILTVSTELLDDRPDLVHRYVSGLLRASRWAAAHAGEAWRIVAAEVGVAEEWARAGYADDLVQNLQPRGSEVLLDVLQSRADFQHDRDFLPRRVDVRGWLDTDPLQQAMARQRNQHGRDMPIAS